MKNKQGRPTVEIKRIKASFTVLPFLKDEVKKYLKTSTKFNSASAIIESAFIDFVNSERQKLKNV